jgi:nucleoside-diphosphate-sugar epimerase
MTTHLIIGCGYLGRHVAALWQAQGKRVSAVTRTTPVAQSGIEPILCDVLNPASLRSLPAANTVLYAVGLDRTSGATMRDVYVNGLGNVLDHLPKPKHFLYVSSSSVYGQSDGSWVDETSTTEPNEDAGKIVLASENLLRSRLPEAILLRFAGIYGPGRLLRRQTLEKGEPIVGDAAKWLNLIQVEDGARAILAAEERGRPGCVYNICDDHPVRRRYFYLAEARVLGVPEPRFVPPPTDQPTPPHEKANRRINNRRMKEELRVELRYPNYDQGLRASVARR